MGAVMSRKTDWAWVAGIIDGEGCIVINRNYAKNRSDLCTDSFRLYVQIAMGCQTTLESVHEITGVGSIQPHMARNKRCNASFCWMTCSRDAATVLRGILPYAVTKRQEILEALEFMTILPWLPGGRGGNTKKPQTLVDKMIRHYWKLRMLKPRWRFFKQKLTKTQKMEIKRLQITEPTG